MSFAVGFCASRREEKAKTKKNEESFENYLGVYRKATKDYRFVFVCLCVSTVKFWVFVSKDDANCPPPSQFSIYKMNLLASKESFN